MQVERKETRDGGDLPKLAVSRSSQRLPFESVQQLSATRPMARISVADVLHRGVVLSLVGLTVYGIGAGVMIHRDTLRRGRGA